MAELREQVEALMPLVRLFDRLDIDLHNREDQRILLEALRLLRKLRQDPNIEAKLAMLAEQYDRRDKMRAEVRASGWHVLRTMVTEVAKMLTTAAVGAAAVWAAVRGGS